MTDARLQDAIRMDQKLTANEKLVLTMLLARGADVGTQTTYKRIAEDCGFDRRTAIRTVQSLEASGWLACERNVSAEGAPGPSTYRIGGAVKSEVHDLIFAPDSPMPAQLRQVAWALVADSTAGVTSVNQATLAARLGMSVRHVGQWLGELERYDGGPIRFTKTRRCRESGRGRKSDEWTFSVTADAQPEAATGEFSVIADHWLSDVFDVYSEDPHGNVRVVIWGRQFSGQWRRLTSERHLALCLSGSGLELVWDDNAPRESAWRVGNHYQDSAGAGSLLAATTAWLTRLRQRAEQCARDAQSVAEMLGDHG